MAWCSVKKESTGITLSFTFIVPFIISFYVIHPSTRHAKTYAVEIVSMYYKDKLKQSYSDSKFTETYEGVSKNFRTGRLEWELQMVLVSLFCESV
jgi:hypothetical protein